MKTITYVAPSNIHGMGLFASENILPGKKIVEFEGYDSIKWTPYLITTDDRCYEVTSDAKYANHSTSPNATVRSDILIAIYEIPTGTEITFDYGW